MAGATITDVKWDGSSNKLYFITNTQTYDSTPSVCTVTLAGGGAENLTTIVYISMFDSGGINKLTLKAFKGNDLYGYVITEAQLISGAVSVHSSSHADNHIWQSPSIHLPTETEIRYSSSNNLYFNTGYSSRASYFSSYEPTMIRKLRPSQSLISQIYKLPFVRSKNSGINYVDVSFYYKAGSEYIKLILEGYPSVIPPVKGYNETSLVNANIFDPANGNIYMGIDQGKLLTLDLRTNGIYIGYI